MTAPRRFGPVQLATYLGLEQWQPEPDVYVRELELAGMEPEAAL